MLRVVGRATRATRFWRKVRLPESDRLPEPVRAGPCSRGTWCMAMLCWACLWAAPILAGESDYGVGLSLTHESNIGRVETNPRAEWTQSQMAGFLFREETADVSARVLAQIE